MVIMNRLMMVTYLSLGITITIIIIVVVVIMTIICFIITGRPGLRGVQGHGVLRQDITSYHNIV